MFTPQYRITEHFLKIVEQIASLQEKIRSKNITLPLMTTLKRESLEKNAHSSTSIEGNILTLEQVSLLNRKEPLNAALKEKQEALNYLEALRWILKNSGREINKTALLHLHTIITKNLLSAEKVGKFKIKQNYVKNEKNIVIYTPPSPKECPKLVGELLNWVNSNEKKHPITLSSIFHLQLVNIHPFSDGNGRVARSSAQWVLYQNDFDSEHIYALDEYFAEDRRKYYEKIEQARELDNDFTYWIEYVAQGILETVEKVYSRVSRFSYSKSKKIQITPKQEALLNLLNLRGSASSKEIGIALKINRARVNQLIGPLVESAIIESSGKARATRYFLGK